MKDDEELLSAYIYKKILFNAVVCVKMLEQQDHDLEWSRNKNNDFFDGNHSRVFASGCVTIGKLNIIMI